MWRAILAYAKPYWRTLFLLTSLIGIMAVLNQAEPFIAKRITDAIVSSNRDDKALQIVISLLATLLVVKIVQSSLNRLTWSLNTIFVTNFESHLKRMGFAHLMKLSMSFFNEQSSGQMMNKLDRGVNRIVQIVSNSGAHFFPGVVTALISFSIVLRYEWRIGITILVAFIPYILINRWRFQRNAKLERQEYKLYDEQYGHFWEVISSMALIKAFRAEAFEKKRLEKFFRQYIALRRKIETNTNKAVVGDFLLETWSWGIYAFVAWEAWRGAITLGTMTLLIGMTRLIREPLWQLNWIFWEVKKAQIGVKDFFRIMNTQPDIADPKKPKTLQNFIGGLAFENISFTYLNQAPIWEKDPHDEPGDEKKGEQGPQVVFEDVTFAVEPGKTTALVGPSGSGKTTIAALAMRFFDPQAGRVLLDGIDIRELRQSELRSHVGIVTQDAFLFADTIAENLRYAKPDATVGEMWQACRVAYAEEFIRNLPNGLETKIGDRGVKLSGGQRQRISLARTVLRNPDILILDEATSALDSESEMYIQQALHQLLKKRTAIVIAHRLSTIQRADNIIVLKNHRVFEQGTHYELLQKNGLYASLFKIQSGDTEKLKEWDLVAG